MGDRQPGWMRWLPALLLLAFSLQWLARSPTFPVGIDPYYHLMVAQQVVAAGGPIAHETWQYAPIGRAHLYPPLFHLLLGGLLKAGCSELFALRLLTVLLVPLVLGSIYLAMRRLVSFPAAVASLWIAMAPFAWILQIAGALASAVALVELVWLLVAFAERRTAAITGLVTLLFLTHLGLSLVSVASLLACHLLGSNRRDWRRLKAVGVGTAFALPWLAHVFRHAGTLHIAARYENQFIEWLPLVFLLAGFGAWRSVRQAGSARLLLGLWLGFCLMAYPFTFRWLSGEGLLPVILLAGFGLAELAGRLTQSWRSSHAIRLGIAVIGGLVMIAPSVVHSPSGMRILWCDTTPFHLGGASHVERKSNDLSLYAPHMEQLVSIIAAMTQPDEILWSNAPYAGGLIASLSHRASSSAMFYELPPAETFDPIAAAHLVIWFPVNPLPGVPELDEIIRLHPLKQVAEYEMAILFRKPGALGRPTEPQPIIPWWLAFVLLLSVLGSTLWDVQRRITPNDGKTQRNFH